MQFVPMEARSCYLFMITMALSVVARDPTMSGYGRPDGTGFEGLLTFQSANYSKFDRPMTSCVNITVLVHLESMRDISSDASMDFYLVQFWTDPRIHPVKSQLKVTGRVLPNDVWYPDTYFLLVRDLIYSDEEQYIVVTGQGSVEYNRKVKLSTPCSPNVVLFPFDVVRCTLVLTSFGYTSEEVNYIWLLDEGSPGCYIDQKNNNVDHLGFYLMGVELKSGKSIYGGANYSSLETIIYLKRKYSAYVMQVYFPAALIVILSWTIFWINLHATPARASLGVTTVLTMLTLATQSTAHNEKHVNNKVTAIDIYLWVCFVFVIFAMIEFALSDFTTHRHLDEMSVSLRSPSHRDKCILLVNQNANHKRLHMSSAVKESMVTTHRRRVKSGGTSRTKCQTAEYRHGRNGETIIRYSKQCNGFHGPNDLLLSQGHSHSSEVTYGKVSVSNSKQRKLQNGRSESNVVNSADDSTNLAQENEAGSLLDEVETKNTGSKPSFHSLNVINNIARVLFPVLFLAFNIVYWMTLLVMISTNESYQSSSFFTSLDENR